MLFHSVQGAGGLGSGTPPTLAYVNNSTYTATVASTTHTISRPLGTQYRDLIFIFVASGSSATITLDSGWTALRSVSVGSGVSVVAYRFVKAGEASTYTITQSSSRGLVASCIAFSGAQYNTNVTGVGSNTATVPLTLTPFNATSDALIYVSASDATVDRTSTPPTGYTEVAELYTNVSSSQMNLTVTYRLPNSGQSTSAVTNTWSGTDNLRAYFVDVKQA